MSETEAGRDLGALERLDAKVPSSFYWQLTLLATIGGFLFDTTRRTSARH